ncbi:peptidase T [Chitinophaga ginsengisegetis]|uniref:peptidase T n=1 Tax=Chitinophaga ginsengisegetis TaxID=393003 RepID=UPI000DB9E131|nr:peptidase T [Chitinophaga ginsengisegetis]MDR6567151.1 tripeptide aminopeptidase [Chitinophaga ginsengisegetis]MDR6646881.1 tripeptide aminopeptidase [Chitinophaga ginsengisegetis]MDR6653231.1 tripeptide aminopeptidase [Chitinophaga ginsengisegetis]
MFTNYSYTVDKRFMRYAQIDTQSDPMSNTFPTTEKQKDLSRLLVKELQEMGITDAELDEHGYVYATIPANTDKKVPVICFCSHVDTSSDSSGTGVKPIVHHQYDGGDIVLPDDETVVISAKEHPYLASKKGDDIITASGTTLLGADDKAGVAEIMDAANFLMTHPEVKHGAIRILFTPDEEVGRGVEKVDMKKLAADFGYTMDGGELGSLEDENFSADGARITVYGISAHPGSAKDKLVSAIKIAGEIVDALPKDSLSPETTDDREGFIHPVRIQGTVEKTEIDFIIRDFETAHLEAHETFLRRIMDKVLAKHHGAKATLKVTEQYRNMKEVLVNHPEVTANAAEAIRRAGVQPLRMSIRGGTDGSRLSFMGLPCPNIFTGEMALHSKHEYVSIQDMQKAVQTIVYLAQVWEEKA